MDRNFTDEELRYLVEKGPMQPMLKSFPKYPEMAKAKDTCMFASGWYKGYPLLEYSMSKDKAFCHACRLFQNGSVTVLPGIKIPLTSTPIIF